MPTSDEVSADSDSPAPVASDGEGEEDHSSAEDEDDGEDPDEDDDDCDDGDDPDDDGVWWDPVTTQVWTRPPGKEGRRIIGRISPWKQNTPQECVSVYCRLHGCSLCHRVEQFPSQASVLAWFADGLAMPPGRDPVSQRRHKGKFPRTDA